MADKIFISYRRADSLGWSGRIYDHLWPVFGKERVFFDLDSLYPGVDWDEAIDRTIEQCGIVVLVIGPRWASMEDESGRRRLHLDDDTHAYEVATALESGTPILPVTIDGGTMPSIEELPERLGRLTRKQAFALSPSSFSNEMRTLVELLERAVGPGSVGDDWSPLTDDRDRVRPGPTPAPEHEPTADHGVTPSLLKVPRIEARQFILSEYRSPTAAQMFLEQSRSLEEQGLIRTRSGGAHGPSAPGIAAERVTWCGQVAGRRLREIKGEVRLSTGSLTLSTNDGATRVDVALDDITAIQFTLEDEIRQRSFRPPGDDTKASVTLQTTSGDRIEFHPTSPEQWAYAIEDSCNA